MNAQDFIFDYRRDGQVVEHGAEVLPDGNFVATLALVVEAVHSRHLFFFVAASQQVDHIGPLNLVRQQETHRLNALISVVHVVPE